MFLPLTVTHNKDESVNDCSSLFWNRKLLDLYVTRKHNFGLDVGWPLTPGKSCREIMKNLPRKVPIAFSLLPFLGIQYVKGVESKFMNSSNQQHTTESCTSHPRITRSHTARLALNPVLLIVILHLRVITHLTVLTSPAKYCQGQSNVSE